MAHPTKRRIIECLLETNLSFTELLNAVRISNHGRFGYHLRTLKTFIELEPSTKKYHLTDRGRILAACIRDFRFITSRDKELTEYVEHLRFGDHAVAFYDTDYFKRKMVFPYIKRGLSEGQAVVYLVSEDKMDSEIREIQKYGINLDSLQREAFTIMSAHEWYLEKGKAQAEAIIANCQKLIKKKQKAGFTGLRAAGDTEVFYNYAKSKELLRYEAALDRKIAAGAHRLVGLCLYDTHRLDEKQFTRVCSSHGHLISKGIVGKWTV